MSVAPRPTIEPETAVRDRYSAAAAAREPSLCCPVDYDPRHLEVIPTEVLERDYGCGDPSRHLRPGDRVLDLGSGSGKICFIASQIVGPEGHVIGIDMNQEMLALARRAAPLVADRIGYDNVEFRRGRIQDLGVNLDLVDRWLRENPVATSDDLAALESETARIRSEVPLVADGSVDVVVSNCVLNLVRESDKTSLLREIYRVLRPGGRIAVSDIVADEPVPNHLKNDPDLWSGCVSGAFEERALLEELEAAGFYGIAIENWETRPFSVVEGIEFRSITVTANKGLEGPCLEANQAVVYRGPWRRVEDDDGHVLIRGARTAVCAKTYGILSSGPYRESTITIPPHREVPGGQQEPFDCARTALRDPRETKSADPGDGATPLAGPDGSSCC